MQEWRKSTDSLSDGQAVMTLHLHHTIGAILKDIVLRKGPRDETDPLWDARVEEVLEYSFRWEF